MAMPPKKRNNRDVVLPYRRSFITADTLAQTVADVMAEFDKLEIATDELLSRLGSEDFEAFKKELEALRDQIKKDIEELNDGNIIEKIEDINNALANASANEDALIAKLQNLLREDVEDVQKELQAEVDAAKTQVAESEKNLTKAVSDLQASLDKAKDEWNQVELNDEQLENIKNQLDSDIAEKIKAGDDQLAAHIAALQKVVADENSSMAADLAGLKAQTNSNLSEITSLKETVTSNEESTAKRFEVVEATYTNVWDAANQASADAADAKKDGQMALNSTKWMKTYQLVTEGATDAPASRAATPEFAGVKEIREDMILHEAKKGINLVVIDRKTQQPRGNYFWAFDDEATHSKWVKDFDDRIKSFDENYMQMVFTYQYDGTFLSKLKPSLALIGGSEEKIDSVEKGATYILVGHQDFSTSLEQVAPVGGKVNFALSMYRSNMVGVDGFTPAEFSEMEERINTAEERLSKEVKRANARIDAESETRTNADGAFAKQLGVIEGKANSNEAAIKNQDKVLVDALKAQTERIDGAESKVEQAVASVTEIATTLTDKVNAATSTVNGLNAKVLDNEAKIQSESEARASADEAVSQQVSAMESTVNNNDAIVKSLQKTVSDNNSALSQRVDSLVASVDAASKAGVDNALNLKDQNQTIAKVTTDVKAVVDKSNSTASSVTQLTTRMGAAESSIVEAKNSVTALDKAVTSRLGSLESSVNQGIAAQIKALEQTIATKDAAMSKRVTDVTSEVNNVKSTVQTVSSTAADTKGKFEAMWGVKTSVNQLTAGFGLLNDGKSTAMVLDVDRLALLDRKGGKTSPFEVVNGVVRIKNANIDTAGITSLVAGKIDVKNISAAKITGSAISGGTISGTTLTGSNLNIANKVVVNTAGAFTLQDNTAANRGLKITNNAIKLWDNNGVLRIQISL
ncbi:hypothetical protein TacPo2_60 [Pantoea bacteriophage TacPo2]